MSYARKNARSFTRASYRAVLGAVGAAALLAALGADPAAAKVVAKVNGVEITDEDMKVASDDLAASIPRELKEKARETYVLDYLIDEQLVVQKAQADKLAETPDFARKLAYLRDKALMDLLLTKVAKDAATEAALKATYDEAAKNQKPETEYHARHILVPTEDEAKAALKRVKGGEDFAKVATELSKDTGAKGGDLSWFTKDRMVPEFGEAVSKMETGQISEPLKTEFGWHVIKLEEKRPRVFPPYDQVKDQVTRYVIQKAQGELVLKLREAAKIERTDAPAPAPAAAAPAAAPAAPAAAKPAEKK